MRKSRKRLILAAISAALFVFTGCGIFQQQERIKEIDAQVNELVGQKDDLYAIKSLADELFSDGASQIVVSADGYAVLDADNEDITERYSEHEASIKLDELLKEYDVVHIIFQKNNATILECGPYLEDAENGSYQRRLVLTNESFDEESIENYYDVTAGLKVYEREVDEEGAVVWKFDNGANIESIKAMQIYDDVWSFEKQRKDGILAIFSV